MDFDLHPNQKLPSIILEILFKGKKNNFLIGLL